MLSDQGWVALAMASDWDLVDETGLGCKERATVLGFAELLLSEFQDHH